MFRKKIEQAACSVDEAGFYKLADFLRGDTYDVERILNESLTTFTEEDGFHSLCECSVRNAVHEIMDLMGIMHK